MRYTKKIISALLCLVMVFSVCGYATETVDEKAEEETKEAHILQAIANNLEVYVRYPEVDEESLLIGALNEIFKDNPELLDKALTGMLSSIDENSVYYNKDDAAKLYESLEDEIVGIGITVLERDGKIIVSQPVPGTPAEKAGVKAGDIIVEADGTSLKGMDLDTAIGYIRGEEGTSVTVKVWRSSINAHLSFTMVREKVVTSSAEYEEIEDDSGKVAKITLFSFTENSHKHFKEALDKADKAGIKNIIIDLRNNGGGYLDQAILIADEFLPKGTPITYEDHKIDVLDVEYTAKGEYTEYNVVVLINEMSASASEVLTAALKENGKAKVIGENSFGKGTVQRISALSNGGVIKYTIAYYLTPKGNNIHKIGIMPDAVVKNSFKETDMSQFGEFDYNKTFAPGDKAPEIKTAKEMLSYLGVYIGEIDDIYDENMRLAVMTFQSIKEELFPYGVLDKTTQFSLYSTMSELKEEVDDQLKAALDAF